MQKSSLPTYQRAWRLYNQFYIDVFSIREVTIPINSATLALFIAYLFGSSYSPSTVNTYISALGYYHKLAGLPDPSKTFYISEMLKGYSKLGNTLDTRLPITLPILTRMICLSGSVFSSHFGRTLFCAMCCLAFFGFMRIGEITVNGKESSKSVLQISQVERILSNKGDTMSLKIIFKNFKHCYNQPSFSLIIAKNPCVCPVAAIESYIKLRGTKNGPFFVNGDGKPVSRAQFSSMLSLSLKACNLNSSKYKGHSFRIGAATYAAQQGLSDAKIRLLGRWKSDAFRKYIRINSTVSI